MSYQIIIRGPLGSGKSTLSKEIARRIGGQYIAIDRILDEHGLTKDKEEGYISQKSFLKANEIASLEASKVLKSGVPVVFDGNFYWKSQIEDLIKKLEFPSHVFTLNAPLEVCIGRDAARSKTHGEDAARAVYKKSTEFDYGMVIDVTRPLKECVDEVISHLPK